MTKANLDKLRTLHNRYMAQSTTACACKDWCYAEICEAKAVAVCDVLAALDGISYTQAVEMIIEIKEGI